MGSAALTGKGLMRNELICLGVLLALATSVSADVVEDLESSGVSGGVVVHLGCGDGVDTVRLRRSGRYVVQGLETSDAKVLKARQVIRAAGCYGPVSAYKIDGKNLPYVDNFVNLIIVSVRGRVSDEEIMRVLAPRGVVMENGRKTVKPWPADMDEWNHFLHGPDNNAVANDRIVDIPRSIQWVSGPRWGRSHEELASMSAAVSANGRVFFIVDKAPLASVRFASQWELVARDAFNGTLLWRKQIAKWSDHLRHFRAGPVHLPRRLVASGDTVYVTPGLDAPVTAFDAATGQVQRVYKGTERAEEILVQDGVLYLVVGTSERYRQGEGLHERGEPKPTEFRYVTALDASTGRSLWKKSCSEGEYLLPLSLTVKGERVFYQSTSGVVGLEAASGRQIWKTQRQTPALRMSFSAPTLVATEDVLFCADRIAPEKQAARDKVEWGVHGWNQAGFPRRGKSVLRAYGAETGEELWSTPCGEGYNSPVDVFVVGDVVWVGSDYKGYDVKTGRLVRHLNWKGAPVAMPHHRCYRNKATERLILTGRAGIEVASLEKGWQGNNSWIRGTCQYGIMPCNGLLYAPPDACACFPKVKLSGFFAAAPQRGADGRMPFPDEAVLEKGPAYGESTPAGQANPDDWPMYRRDINRSGMTPTRLQPSLQRRWSARVDANLTQPVIVGTTMLVVSMDTHTLHALSATDGKTLWNYTAGGRIDSAPTVYKGRVFFGSRDGWVYALRASDGRLAWRFRAAPRDWQVGVLDQLESVWPVHGAVLIQNDTLYVTAGRSTYLDGGIVLYRLDPETGRERSRTVVSDLDPDTGQQTGFEAGRGFDMEGATSDVLSGDGESVFMKHLHFDRSGQLTKEEKPHLFCMTGFLGEEWFVRSYWLIGTDVGAGWGGWADAANKVPAGRILCFDEDRLYGYGRKEVASGAAGHKLDAYHLFATPKVLMSTKPTPKGRKKTDGDAKQAVESAPEHETGVWADDESLVVRAMVLTSETLVVAGPPDLGRKESAFLAFKNGSEALAAFRGEKGVFLRVVSRADGATLSEYNLGALPVFDGMSAAGGCLYLALKDGTVECWGPSRGQGWSRNTELLP